MQILGQLERFVRESPWEHQNVESHLREEVPDEVQGPDAALIVDGMAIPKSGEKSVGVARQWCGATGKVDNCQVTVNCAPQGRGAAQFRSSHLAFRGEAIPPEKMDGGRRFGLRDEPGTGEVRPSF